MSIFVGGTGRSGTTQLAIVIGEHPDVFNIPTETRFLIDPDGVEDLARVLIDHHTPFHAARALARFADFLERRGNNQPHFLGLGEIFGHDRYDEWAKRLLSELTWYSVGEPERQYSIGRYFGQRPGELFEILRRSIDELFSAGARDTGKPYWCEKTPLNMLSTPFLWKLFPDARIVHIARHPVQVVASHLDQNWAPDNVQSTCDWLEPLYHRWLALVEQHGDDDRLIDLRLEELADDWPRKRAELFDGLGLPDAETSSTMANDRVMHWRQLDADDESLVRQRLGFAIEALGYD